MAYTVIWSTRATSEFEQAIEFLKADSPKAAAKLRFDLLSEIALLQINPESGARFERIASGRVREIYCHPYRVIYRVNRSRNTIELITIWHSARDEPDLFH